MTRDSICLSWFVCQFQTSILKGKVRLVLFEELFRVEWLSFSLQLKSFVLKTLTWDNLILS